MIRDNINEKGVAKPNSLLRKDWLTKSENKQTCNRDANSSDLKSHCKMLKKDAKWGESQI